MTSEWLSRSYDSDREITERLFAAIRADHKIIASLKNGENQISHDYSGREVYELLQNADDAGAESAVLDFSSPFLFRASNGGSRPFTIKGLDSIRLPHISPKAGDDNTIGSKGLGFRSLLNWSHDITIHSNGVRCHFSEDTALDCWRKFRPQLPPQTVAILEGDTGAKSPLPILTIPAVGSSEETTIMGEPNPDHLPTTIIEVCLTDKAANHLADNIIDTLKAIRPEILLFTHHLKQLDILLPDGIRRKLTAVCLQQSTEPTSNIQISDYSIEIATGCPQQASTIRRQRFRIFSHIPGCADPYDFHACVGCRTDSPDYAPGILFSFFPTRTPISLPAALHADFDIDMSRNSIHDTPRNACILRRLGQLLCIAAEDTAGRPDAGWLGFRMLLLSDNEYSLYPSLADTIISRLADLYIIPLATGGNSSLKETRLVSASLGHFLATDAITATEEAKALRHCAIPPDTALEDRRLFSRISSAYDSDNPVIAMARRLLPASISSVAFLIGTLASRLAEDARAHGAGRYSDLAALIQAIHGNKTLYPSQQRDNLQLLVDTDGKMIPAGEEAWFVESGDKDSPAPAPLRLRCVHPELAQALTADYRRFHPEGSKERATVHELQSLCACNYTDITKIRELTARISRTGSFTNDELAEILRWYYRHRYSSSDDKGFYPSEHLDTDPPRPVSLHLPTVCGKWRPASQLIIIHSDTPEIILNHQDILQDYILHGTAKEWSAKLHIPSEKETVDFITGYLGAACYCPSSWGSFSREHNYIDEARIEPGPSSAYCNKFPDDRRDKYNCTYQPDLQFISLLAQAVPAQALSHILGLLLSEPRTRESLKQSHISMYWKNATRSISASFSYSAFLLRRQPLLRNLRNTVIGSTVLRPPVDYTLLRKAYGLSTADIERALLDLGASHCETDLSFDTLFREIAGISSPSGAASRYNVLRRAILKKLPDRKSPRYQATLDEMRPARERHLKAGTQLFAVKEGKTAKFPLREIRYWDNDRFPRRVLDSIPRLAMPSRSGEGSVREIFGVANLDNLRITVVYQLVNEKLTQCLASHIITVSPYILAYRLSGISDNDTAAEAATTRRRLRSLAASLRVVESATYAIEEDTSREWQMETGDILPVTEGNSYMLKADATTLEALLHDVRCLEGLVDAVAILLSVKGELFLAFLRDILRLMDAADLEFVARHYMASDDISRGKALMDDPEAAIEDGSDLNDNNSSAYESGIPVGDMPPLPPGKNRVEVVKVTLTATGGNDEAGDNQNTGNDCLKEEGKSNSTAPDGDDDKTRHKANTYLSEEERNLRGRRAELFALRFLEDDIRYCNVKGVSKNLCGENGNDGAGYDLTYSDVDHPETTRFMEVKNFSGSQVFITRNEYLKGCNLPNYDLGLVRDNRLLIVRNAFDEKADGRLIPEPYLYSLPIRLEDESSGLKDSS